MDIARGHRVFHLLAPSLALAISLNTPPAAASQPCSQPTFERGPSVAFLSRTCPAVFCNEERPFNLFEMDVNQDSRPDVIAVSVSAVVVLLRQADGTFIPSGQSTPGGQAALLAELDNDGVPDLVVVYYGQLSVRSWSEGALGAAQSIAEGVAAVAAGDFDGDGLADLVVVRHRLDLPFSSSDVEVLRNNGNRTFTALPAVHLPFRITKVSAGHLYSHTVGDIIVMEDAPTVSRRLFSLAGLGNGTFGPSQPILDSGVQDFALADLNGDGWLDIVAAVTDDHTGQCSLRTYIGSGDGRFDNWTANLTSPEFCGVSNFAFADFNGDGLLDVAVNRVVLLGDGKLGFSRPIRIDSGPLDVLVPITTEVNAAKSLATVSDWVEYFWTPGYVVGQYEAMSLLLLRNDCNGPGVSSTRVMPFVGSVPGQAGALFESDLSLTNTGTTDTDVGLRYAAAFGEGSGSATTRLAAGQQIFSPSALGYLRSLGLAIPEEGSQGGSLRVHFAHLSSPDAGVVASRTASRGAGLWYAGPGPQAAAVYIGPLKEDASDRTNLALVNAGAPDAGVAILRVSVYSTDPSAPGSVTFPEVRLRPGEFRQIGRILSARGLSAASGYVSVVAQYTTAPFLALAVVNDNVTSDGSYLAPTGSFAETTVRVVPSVVETGPYSTEVTLTNMAYHQTRVRLDLPAPSADSEAEGRAVLILDLAPWESRTIPDIFEELRLFGLVPPRGPALVRPMIVTAEDDGAVNSLLVASRVRNPAPSGGFYGVFVPALDPGEMATTSAVVSDLRQDESNRTNLAITNMGDSSLGDGEDTFRIEIFDGDKATRVAALEGIAVQRNGWRQLNSVLAGFAPGTKHGWARVTRTSGSGPFIVYAVINDGARPGERTGDGSFVLGRPQS